MVRRSLALAALALSAAACGGSDDDDGATITDVGTWMDTYVSTRLCPKAHACKADYTPPQGFTFEDIYGTDVATCRNAFVSAEQVRASVAGGRVRFDADAGRDCLAMLEYESQTCPVFWATEDPAVCDTVLVGQVAVGGACSFTLECAPGLYCAGTSCAARVTGGGLRDALTR